MRTRVQRDRDRVIHCSSFRRLEYNTQVFVNHEGDNYRTRLTHSLEGAQIGRTVARAMGLNEELTECLVLGHDLGALKARGAAADILQADEGAALVADDELVELLRRLQLAAGLDGHLPLALLLEPVGMGSREGSD